VEVTGFRVSADVMARGERKLHTIIRASVESTEEGLDAFVNQHSIYEDTLLKHDPLRSIELPPIDKNFIKNYHAAPTTFLYYRVSRFQSPVTSAYFSLKI